MSVGSGLMQINERLRKFPIKFYQNGNKVYYENSFFHGDAKDLDAAFKQISQKDWYRDLVYYYDDVTDVKIGAFTPAYDDRKKKGMTYLGQLDMQLEIDTGWGTGEHSVTHLSKNPQDIDKQNKWVSNLKRQEQMSKIWNKVKDGVKKLAGVGVTEMFDPIKTRQDLICQHCGEIIPVGTYYENYHGNYHLECIWDKLCNTNPHNISYEDSREFFFGLQQYLEQWPNIELDTQDDYEADLEFVKINDRRLKSL